MPLDREEQDLGRKCFDFMAESVTGVKNINEMRIGDRMHRVPFMIDADPNRSVQVNFSAELMDFIQGEEVLLLLDTTGSGMIYLNGNTIGAVDSGHVFFVLPKDTKKLDFRVDLTSRGMFGSNPYFLRIDGAHLLRVKWNIFETAMFMLNIYDYMMSAHDASKRRELNEMINAILGGHKISIQTEQAIGASWIGSGLKDKLPSISSHLGQYYYLADLYSNRIRSERTENSDASKIAESLQETRKASEGKVTSNAIEVFYFGHAHIDAAWLWPYSESKRKVNRTFINMLELLNSGYAFSFLQSSSLFYEWFKEQEPGRFKEIKENVIKNSWILAGGMHVESDTNLLPSEALVRQFVYGQGFFQKEFGRTARIGWLPDSFGFSAQLPQIMIKSGIEVFVTHKLIWNDTTDFPLHAFMWKGLDGSAIPTEILVHSYDIPLRYSTLENGIQKFRQAGKAPMICAFGLGDGGGGPSIPMLIWLKFMGIIPEFSSGKKDPSDSEYVDSIRNINDLPVYSGELYLQRHRGVYTTNSRIKKMIADLERNLRYLDTLFSMVSLTKGRIRFNDETEKLWKILLTACFHDLLPGSANFEAYEEAFSELIHAIGRTEEILVDTLNEFSGGRISGHIAANTTQWFMPSGIPCRSITDHAGHMDSSVSIKAWSIVTFSGNSASGSEDTDVKEESDRLILSSGNLKVSISTRSGEIFDCSFKGRSKKAKYNFARLFVDEPGEFDAWELTKDSVSARNEIARKSFRIMNIDRQAGTIRMVHEFEDGSHLIQEISTVREFGLLRISNTPKPASKLRLFKSFFKKGHADETIECSIPYGWFSRKMEDIKNTQFEFPALNWVNYGKGEDSVRIISDHLHGYGFSDDMLSISIAKFPVFPDPWSEPDNPVVVFYIDLSGEDIRSSDFNRKVTQLLNPPLVVSSGDEESDGKISEIMVLPLTISSENVKVEAMKISEDKTGIILRLLETSGRKCRCRIESSLKYRYKETDILERPHGQYHNFGDEIEFCPFEIKTLKIILDD